MSLFCSSLGRLITWFLNHYRLEVRRRLSRSAQSWLAAKKTLCVQIEVFVTKRWGSARARWDLIHRMGIMVRVLVMTVATLLRPFSSALEQSLARVMATVMGLPHTLAPVRPVGLAEIALKSKSSFILSMITLRS
jgi:hypothetical protein